MVCNGKGYINPNTKLPNGQRVRDAFGKQDIEQKKQLKRIQPEKEQKRLNVSRKAVFNLEAADTVEGYDKAQKTQIKRNEPEKAMSPRLQKVLASGKKFLIVTETEPYYIYVYGLIREQERKQGSWTWEDEEAYVEALMTERQRLINGIAVLNQKDVSFRKEVNNG
jgi:hypothetical protein